MMMLVTLLITMAMPLPANDIRHLAAAPWVVIDDGVMGGRSAGQVSSEEGVTIFEGDLSLENNGGFSSIRLPLNGGLGEYSGVRLKVRGDGRTYQMRLRHGTGFDGVVWRAEFDTGPQWSVVELAFDDFWPGFRGRPVPNAGPVIPADVQQIGFLLGDKNPGAFRLEVGAIEGIVR